MVPESDLDTNSLSAVDGSRHRSGSVTSSPLPGNGLTRHVSKQITNAHARRYDVILPPYRRTPSAHTGRRLSVSFLEDEQYHPDESVLIEDSPYEEEDDEEVLMEDSPYEKEYDEDDDSDVMFVAEGRHS